MLSKRRIIPGPGSQYSPTKQLFSRLEVFLIGGAQLEHNIDENGAHDDSDNPIHRRQV
jgi:hypothetical protein